MKNISRLILYFRPMVLVTGGTGLVGSHLLYELILQGESPRAIYRTAQSKVQVERLFSFYAKDGRALFDKIQWVEADLLNIPALESALKGVKEVYHCAALISFDPADYDRLRDTNEKGSSNIVNLCLKEGVKRLCYVSSIAALGKNQADLNISEETEWTDYRNNVYSISKHLAEMQVWRGSQEGLEVAIVNPGVIIGPGDWNRGSGLLFKRASRGGTYFPPGGTGFVTVKNVVAVMCALMRAETFNEQYILVDENLTYREIMSKIAVALNKPVPRKELQLWQLRLLWRLDFLRSALSGKRRRLTRAAARSFRKQYIYRNDKLMQAFPLEYQSLDQAIEESATYFLAES